MLVYLRKGESMSKLVGGKVSVSDGYVLVH